MSQQNPTITFIDEQSDWKINTLFDSLYKQKNIPYGYEDFFNRKDITIIVKTISDKLFDESKSATIFPLLEDTFKSLRCKNPKVLLLGQDPYHNPDDKNKNIPGSAIGLSFCLPKNATYINPSFQSIQKEVETNGYTVDKKSGNISRWVEEGVILLNSALTVNRSDAGSHTAIWAEFTEKLIEYLSEKYNLVWLLWGKDAQAFDGSIKNRSNQLILKSSHPMPLAAYKSSGGNPAFIGSGFCTKTNEWLVKRNKSIINWSIP